jgi:SAM-dependent methyltransferase
MQYCPGDTTIIDFASEMLRYARKRAKIWGYAEKELEINADLESLPFVNEQFDFVHMFGVIEHLDHPKNALRELLRCTRTGGALFVNIPRMWSLNFLAYMVTGTSPARWHVRSRRSVLAKVLDLFEYPSKLRFYRWFSQRQIEHLLEGLPCRILKRIPGVYLPVTGIVTSRILTRLARSPWGQSLMTTLNAALAGGPFPPAGEMYLLIKQ